MVQIPPPPGNHRPSPSPSGLHAPRSEDAYFMAHAVRLARAAGRRGEVPVGAVAVSQGQVVAAASNRVEHSRDATAHAELLALRLASRRLRSWRLEGTTLYTTLEPCPMCAGAILLARVSRCVYAADDPRKGAFRSVYDVLGNKAGNHHPAVEAGHQAGPAGQLLQDFFRERRKDSRRS